MALLVAIGMTLGMLGDVFMAKLLPVPQYVLWGMGAFGLGHVAYISAFLRLGNLRGLDASSRWGAWAVWLLIGLAVLALAFVPLALGGALFLLSDLILAARLFSGAHFYLIDDVVWLTYGPAQALIVYAVSVGY